MAPTAAREHPRVCSPEWMPVPHEPALAAPRPPEPPAPRPFPLLATAAPVVVSALLFAVTRSPFALLFAVLGPVAAVAGLGDAHWQDRRRRKMESARFEREIELARDRIRTAHARERARLEAGAPSAAVLLRRGPTDAERWRAGLGGALPVSLGTGTIASTVASTVGWEAAPSDAEPDTRLADLQNEAAVLTGAPVVVDAALGVGIVGSGSRGTAVANGILLQLVSRLHPRETEVLATAGAGFDWLAELPHWAGELDAEGSIAEGSISEGPSARVELRPRHRGNAVAPRIGIARDDVVVLVVAPRAEGLPRACRVGLSVEAGGRGRIVRAPEPPVEDSIVLGFVSGQEGAAFARMLAVAARHEGLGAARGELPPLVRFGELDHGAGTASAGLPASLGVDAAGTTTVDLVSDGPHAVVGGTTGTGKSELLVSWILAMAAATPPERFTVLLVDFKGGAAFEALRALPHCVGLVTDLDALGAERALASLAAELRHRERVLGRAGVRSIDELPGEPTPAVGGGTGLARLVIVVDEYAALAGTSPALQAIFADLAARGRSLGIHLILCTQRPAEGIRDTVLANCSLRLSLRVNNRADSESVVGSAVAAQLPRHPPGRAVLLCADGEPAPVQLALASPADVAAVAERWPAAEVRRPWLDPLPDMLEPDAVPEPAAVPGEPPGPGIAFGLLDVPEEQARETARYDPKAEGSLLTLGAHRSGKTGFLAALESAAAVDTLRVPADLEGAWDAMVAVLERVRSGSQGELLLLVDDLDVVVGRFDAEYQQAFLETVLAVLREGRALGVHCVFTARQVSTGLHALAAACEARLLLRLADAQEHVAAGGERSAFEPALPAGGGHWRGHRLQIVSALSPGSPTVVPTEQLDLARHRVTAIVSTAPAALAARFEDDSRLERLEPAGRQGRAEHGVTASGRSLPIGDPDDWQSHLALLAAARAEGAVLFHGCAPADLRALTGRRMLPPPLATAESCWLLEPGGIVSRVRLPQAPRTSATGV